MSDDDNEQYPAGRTRNQQIEHLVGCFQFRESQGIWDWINDEKAVPDMMKGFYYESQSDPLEAYMFTSDMTPDMTDECVNGLDIWS